MRRLVIATVLAVLPWPAIAGDTQRPPASAPIVLPAQPGSTVRPLGGGAIVETPGRPDSSVRPFGSGVLIKTPGQADVRCAPLGSRTVCK